MMHHDILVKPFFKSESFIKQKIGFTLWCRRWWWWVDQKDKIERQKLKALRPVSATEERSETKKREGERPSA